MTDKLVTHSQDGLVYTITLNRPAKRNAISDRLLEALDKAWEAHRTRNRIAHEPDKEITKLETDRALANYEAILKELGFI